MRRLRVLLAGVLCVGVVRAQAPQPTPLPSTPPPTRGKPAISCSDLRGLTNFGISISTAVQVAETSDVPGHCRVSGQVLPEVGFEVNLPVRWNGRLYMFGNGGYAGERFDTQSRIAIRTRALKHGVASAATDTGHPAAPEPLASFARNRQKLLDYAYRSLHVTAETAKLLMGSYYGVPPTKSYFEGCSTGGRQGLILAQRFPADFDGIVVGAPVLNFTATMVSYAVRAQALKSAPIPASKLAFLAKQIYAQCDAKDGLSDGVIDDPRRCQFDPERDLPRCEAGAERAECFTPGQISSLKAIYSDVLLQGKRIFPGWPVSAEAAGANGQSGWDPWIIHDGGRSTSVSFAESFFQPMAFLKPAPDFDLGSFSMDRDAPQLESIHEILDATDADLSAFEKRGGKILMYYGWADPALNPLMGVEYYERVSERMGAATPGFFRLFMVPGMFHCGGGVGASVFDPFGPLVNWTEHGTAPDAIKANRSAKGNVVRSRLLCAYPEVAKYKGSGSVDDASSFSCVKP